MQLRVSEHAMKEPEKVPFTDDMREMVDRLRDAGQVHKVPCAFQFGKTLIVHPKLFDQMKARIGIRIDPFDPAKHLGWTKGI